MLNLPIYERSGLQKYFGRRKTMLKRFTVSFLSAVFALLLAAGIYAEADPQVYIIDDYGYLSQSEKEKIYLEAEIFSEKSGFNIMIAITDDIGTPKTDSHTVEYADDLYDYYCGINTDGILLLINNDTEYDYISTSGACINYYSDYRIDSILDAAYDYIIDKSFADAAYAFIDKIEYYYDKGKINSQQELLGVEVDMDNFSSSIVVLMVIALMVGMVIFSANLKKYKLEKASTAFYVNKNSLNFRQCTDEFMGNFTSRIYSPRSSGSSGGRSGGHSSTHHSSGGGRHGGGGRHR